MIREGGLKVLDTIMKDMAEERVQKLDIVPHLARAIANLSKTGTLRPSLFFLAIFLLSDNTFFRFFVQNRTERRLWEEAG